MSKKYTLDKHDWKKVGKSLSIAFLGVLATFLQEQIPGIDFGSWTPVVVGVNSVLVNLIKMYIRES